MRAITTVAALLLLLGAWTAPAAALSPEEVIKLKKAGVSDATIQKMLDQERQGTATTTNGPITETDDQVIYRAGQNSAADARRLERQERRKEQQSMDLLRGGVIVDQRGGGAGAPTGQ
ncbi:MAG: hypothetical protein V1806_03200 [Pseudomonadota bacterium]